MRQSEPGTGTQYHTFANDPCRCQSRPKLPAGVDCPEEHTDLHKKPSHLTLNGKTWYVGQQYWDSKLNDIATLVVIMGKSSWVDSSDPEDCPPVLVFNYERREIHNMEIDPNAPDNSVTERFQRRYRNTSNLPR